MLVGWFSDRGSFRASLDNRVVRTEQLEADWRRGDLGGTKVRLSLEARR